MFKKRIEETDITKELIESLAEEFKTSITATSIRYVTLRPEYALVISKDSKITRFIADHDHFPYYINITGKVHSDSIAYDYYNGIDIRNKLMPIETHSWIETKYPIKGQLKELAIPLGANYNQVLSFLYVEENWDD